jgi:recombination protein RecT
MTVRQAVAEREKPGPGALVAQYKADFSLVLPSHLDTDQWIRVTQGALRRDPKLAQVALRNPGSLLSALLKCAHLGLEPGDTFHLIPFGNEVVGITDYTGEIELIYRAGAVEKVEAQVVRSKDHFSYRPGEMDRPVHEPDWFGDRGDLIGVYAYGVFPSGAASRVVLMNRNDIEAVKAVSKTANQKDSPWNRWPESMWLKSSIHQLRKWVPSSAEYRSEVLRAEATAGEAARRMDLPTGDLPFDDGDVIDGEVVEDEPDENGEVRKQAVADV